MSHLKRLSRRALSASAIHLVLALAAVPHAFAQRAQENAVSAANDAFGTRVGNESVGLYDPYNARGFSPVQAGNVRIEGLYFDQQAPPNNRVGSGSAVRVGISAQSYSFPAPTGVADLFLRLPGDELVVSTVATFGQYTSRAIEVDVQIPASETLSIGLGAGIIRYENDNAAKGVEWTLGAVARWRPSENVEVSGFGGLLESCNGPQQPGVFTAGAYLPPRYPRHKFFGQTWAKNSCRDSTAGVLGRFALPDDWTVRAGMFRSQSLQHHNHGDLLLEIQPDGSGRHFIYRQPRQNFVSYSGEVRVTKIITAGRLRHTFDATVRGRDVQRDFGGADVHDLGTGYVGVRAPIPEPVFAFGPLTDDHTRQATTGIAYDGLLANVGAVGFGLQKTFYKRSVLQPGLPEGKSDAGPLLYNASLNFFATKDLAFYASYTRGLEESGSAPFNAANRGEAMPVNLTKQVDAGLRYALTPRVTFIAGVFQVEKPYYSINAANVYAALGAVRHRGVEVSLTGQVLEGLTVVGGMVLLQPRVSGDAVDRGLTGRVSVGPKPRNVLLSLQYQPESWQGFGINGQLSHNSDQFAHTDNLLKVDAFTQLNLGARYNFKALGNPASFRVQLQNVTNAFGWGASSSGNFFPRSPRRFIATLAADF